MRFPVKVTRYCGVGLRPKPWALDIQPKPAKQFDRVIQAEAPALEPLEFMIESFDETAGMPALKRVENSILPALQGGEELIKAGDARRFHELAPALKPGLGRDPIRAAFKERCQRHAQQVSLGQGRALLKQIHQLVLLGLVQRCPFPPE